MNKASFALGMSVGMLIVGICVSTPSNSLSADVGGELRSHQVTSTTQKSDREVTLADYGFYEHAAGCSLKILSPTVVKLSDVIEVGGSCYLPTEDDFSEGLRRLDRHCKIRTAVPIVSTRGDWRRRSDCSRPEAGPRDDQSVTVAIVVIVDDPRNPEKH